MLFRFLIYSSLKFIICFSKLYASNTCSLLFNCLLSFSLYFFYLFTTFSFSFSFYSFLSFTTFRLLSYFLSFISFFPITILPSQPLPPPSFLPAYFFYFLSFIVLSPHHYSMWHENCKSKCTSLSDFPVTPDLNILCTYKWISNLKWHWHDQKCFAIFWWLILLHSSNTKRAA